MLKAADFRRYARESLKGRWIKAGGVGILAGLLGAAISISSSAPGSSSGTTSEMIGNYAAAQDIPAMLVAVILGFLLVILLWCLVTLVIGGATTLGYAKYNLNIVDDQNPKLKYLFSQYHRLGTGFGMQFFRNLYIFLWSLLFVIPGILASYSYYMTPYILCEHPEMTAREAISESKKLMKGNRWRLFCLNFSFIGWNLLATAVIGIAAMLVVTPILLVPNDTLSKAVFTGVFIVCLIILIIAVVVIDLTLTPYEEASVAVFYREISEARYSSPMVEEVHDGTEAPVNEFYG